MENTTIEMLKATRLLTQAGLVFDSGDTQIKNGTLQFTDPKGSIINPGSDDGEPTKVKYTLHANGYYRKYCAGGYFHSTHACYQLNRTTQELKPWGWSTGRILIPGEYLLMAERILEVVKKDRAKRNLTK